MPRLEAPPPPENPHANADQIALNPALAVSRQIEAAAATSDRSDLVGLAVADDQRRYVVTDASVKQYADRTITKKVGLPRFRGGFRTFGRPEIETTVKPSGMPRLVGVPPGIANIPGLSHVTEAYGEVEIRRGRTPIEAKPYYVPFVTVEAYDAVGDLIGLEECPQDNFYALCDTLGQDGNGGIRRDRVSAIWTDPEDNAEDLDFTILLPRSRGKKDGRGVRLSEHTGDKDFVAFDEISAQLKARGLDSWEGLSWQHGDVVQEVVFDKAIKKETIDQSTDSVWVRTFGIKTTHNGTTVALEKMSDFAFAKYMQRKTDPDVPGETLQTVRMVREKNESPLADERYRYLGWLGTPRSPEEADEAKKHEADIRKYIDSRTAKNGCESLVDDLDDKVAVWLLSYGDVLSDGQRLDGVIEMTTSLDGKRRIKTLKDAIDEHGLPIVYDTAYQLRETYLESMRRLDHPVTHMEQSLSTILGMLVDQLPHHPELLADTDDAHAIQGAIVDGFVGRSVAKIVSEDDGEAAYSKAMIRLRRQMGPAGTLNKDGQAELKIHKEVVFNRKFFLGHDAPAILKHQVASRNDQNMLRDEIVEAGHAIYVKVKANHAVASGELIRFGHMLRTWTGVVDTQ